MGIELGYGGESSERRELRIADGEVCVGVIGICGLFCGEEARVVIEEGADETEEDIVEAFKISRDLLLILTFGVLLDCRLLMFLFLTWISGEINWIKVY